MTHSSNVVLMTTTFSKDQENTRHKLAVETIRNAVNLGYQLLVVDNSPMLVRQDYVDAGATVYSQVEPGMGGSRRDVFRHALEIDAGFYFWLEPEKECLPAFIAELVEKAVELETSILIPRRNSLLTLPTYQALSEAGANWELNRLLGRTDLDPMFGPRLLSRRGLELLLTYTGQAGGDAWEILFIPLLWAKVQGMAIGSCPIDYVHPAIQTAEEEGDEVMNRKRDIQRTQLIAGMTAEARRLGLIAA